MKPILRQSEIKDYLRCGKCYYRKHIEKIKDEPNSKMALGSSVDTVMNMNIVSKLQTGNYLTLEQSIDEVVKQMDQRYNYTNWGKDDFGRFKDDSVAVIKAMFRELLPVLKPQAVQVEFLVKSDRPFDYQGTMDYVDESGMIRDLKVTTKQGLNFYKINRALQPAGYAIGYRYLTGQNCKGFAIDRIARNPGKGTAEFFPLLGAVSKEDEAYFWEAAEQAFKGIQAGIFLPAFELSWFCDCNKVEEKATFYSVPSGPWSTLPKAK